MQLIPGILAQDPSAWQPCSDYDSFLESRLQVVFAIGLTLGVVPVGISPMKESETVGISIVAAARLEAAAVHILCLATSSSL